MTTDPKITEAKPAKWSVGQIPTNVFDETGVRVARCDFDGDTEHPDAIKNARMIAAALDMLTMLQEMTPALNTCRIIMQDQEARDYAGEIVLRARAIIKKAKGESQ